MIAYQILKIETVIIANRTINCLPASATTTSFQTLPPVQGNSKTFSHRLAGKHSFLHPLVVIPPGNISSGATVIDQYKLKTQDIAATALLDNTQNGVLHALPLYKMTTLQHEDIQHKARQGRFQKLLPRYVYPRDPSAWQRSEFSVESSVDIFWSFCRSCCEFNI